MRFKLDWAGLIVGSFAHCFTLYLRAIFQVQASGGLYLERQFNRGYFCVTSLGGLYLEVLIHGGAYFRNFTVLYLGFKRNWFESEGSKTEGDNEQI